MVDWNGVTHAAEELFQELGPELVAASRNGLIGAVPGFRRLDCDTHRFARFDVASLTTIEAFCATEDGERSRLVVSKFPVHAGGQLVVRHKRSFVSSLLGGFDDPAKARASATWSDDLPNGLAHPAFMGFGCSIALDDAHQLVVLDIAIAEDNDVVPLLAAACEWLEPFPRVVPRADQPWSKHHVSAAQGAVTALTAERLKLEREVATERALVNELTSRAEAAQRAGKQDDVRRALEARIHARRRVDDMKARIEALRTDATDVAAAFDLST